MKNKLIFSISLVLIFILQIGKLTAQDDLKLVWAKDNYTTLESYIDNVTPQDDGTYLATGIIVKDGKHRGYVLHIDENGDVIVAPNGQRGEYILSPPDSAAWLNGNPHSTIKYAYLTSDNSIIAFGVLSNDGLGNTHPSIGVPLGGNPIIPFLKNGLWVTKVDRATKNILVNKLDRCNSRIVGSIKHATDRFIITGFDYPLATNNNNFLLRTYDKDGKWAYDNNSGGYEMAAQKAPNNWVERISKTADGHYTITSLAGVYKYNSTTYAQIGGAVVTRLEYGNGTQDGCLIRPSANIMDENGHHAFFYPRTDGGFWVTGRMGSTVTQQLGWILYYKSLVPANLQSDNCIELTPREQPTSKIVEDILSLPGSNTKYVANYTDASTGKNYIYIIEDIPGTRQFSGTIKEEFALNTKLKAVSNKEGFFSGGQNSGKASIAKYTACSVEATNTQGVYSPPVATYNLVRTIGYKDAVVHTGDTKELDYKVEIIVKNGTVNGQGVGSVLKTYTGTAVRGPIVGNKTSGTLLAVNETFTLVEGAPAKLEVKITLTNKFENNHVPQEATPAPTSFDITFSSPSCTMFSDDVWFFGNYEGANAAGVGGTPKTSKGIIFREDKSTGKMVPKQESFVSKVNSWENSLSVSTPACGGDFIFYTSHDMIYDSNHEPIKKTFAGIDGQFDGNSTTGDGLASYYVGDNKYVFLSVSIKEAKLYAYKLDLNGNGGNGEFSKLMMSDGTNSVGSTGTGSSEVVEVIPKMDTYDQYWIIYYDAYNNKLVLKFSDKDNINLTPHQELDLSTIFPRALNNRYVLNLTANKNYDLFAMCAFREEGNNVMLFNFDPLNGVMSFRESFPGELAIGSMENIHSSYSTEFSNNGRYFYIGKTGNSINNTIGSVQQIDLLSALPRTRLVQNYLDAKVNNLDGGGLKMGPDGILYINTQLSTHLPVILNPEVSFNAPGGGITKNYFEIKATGFGLAFSTGLTPPWVDPINANVKPVAEPDIELTYVGMPNSFDALANDSDADGDNPGTNIDLDITSLQPAVLIDTQKIKMTYNKVTRLVDYTFVNNYTPKKDTIINYTYIIKDRGSPIKMCDEGGIRLYIRTLPKLSLMDSCSFEPKLLADIKNEYTDFEWQEFDGTNWQTLTGSKNKTLLDIPTITTGKQYRVAINHVGKTIKVYSQVIKIKVETKASVGGKTWYKIVEAS